MSVATGVKSRPLGVALVGAGMVAGTHLAAIVQARSHVTLCGVLARRSERAAAVLRTVPQDYGFAPKTYQSLDQVIEDVDVDTVIIATPPNVRAALIGPLVAAGKHILLAVNERTKVIRYQRSKVTHL